ncbi:MAG: carbohydrate ABC transporter permease, partial [Nocardioides sp.]
MSFVSSLDQRRTSVRWGLRGVQLAMLLGLAVICLGPLLWLAKSAVTPTQDTLRSPISLWPNGPDFSIVSQAWTELGLSSYLVNTVVIAAGSWAV